MSTLSVPNAMVLGGDPWSQSSIPRIEVVSSSPFTSETNLKREDLDLFERKLKRRRFGSVLMLPVVLLLMVGGGLAYYLLRPKTVTTALATEKEPNNKLEEANPIGKGRPVKGLIGKRLSATKSDVDVYFFTVKAQGPVLLSARLKGIPYINTSLQIYDDKFKEVVAVDSGPERFDEVLPNQVLSPGRYYAVVQQVAGADPQQADGTVDGVVAVFARDDVELRCSAHAIVFGVRAEAGEQIPPGGGQCGDVGKLTARGERERRRGGQSEEIQGPCACGLLDDRFGG